MRRILSSKLVDTPPVTKKEYAILDLAVQEILEHGSTTQRCPRCGKELVYILQGSRETIRCSDPACIKSIHRGI